MVKGRSLFTSESVTEGHPDKIADQVSDSLLDAVLSKGEASRVGIEPLVTTGVVCVAGEMTTKAVIDIPAVVRETVREIGYTRAKYGFDGDTCSVVTSIDKQSTDIAMGVDTGGAGGKGMMFCSARKGTPAGSPITAANARRPGRAAARGGAIGRPPHLPPAWRD